MCIYIYINILHVADNIIFQIYCHAQISVARPLSLVRISVFPEGSQTGYRYRAVPYWL